MEGMNSQYLQEKWSPVLDFEGLGEIKDNHRRAVTAQLLENQERELREAAQFLGEASPTNSAGTGGFSGGSDAGGPVAGFDPVLISLIRRSMPNLIAYDICGVQPMSGPTGLIFAMRSKYGTQGGDEAFFNEVDSTFSGQNNSRNLSAGFEDGLVGFGTTNQDGTNPSVLNPVGSATTNPSPYNVGGGMATGNSESLGDGAANAFNEMAFSIEKVTVTAKSRALKAEYSLELAQDLKAIHGLNAEAELANILSSEVLAEINREVVRTVYTVAKKGAQNNVATPGVFDLDVDSNGRWSVEKFKGLLFQVERDANAIAQDTRRGKGNFLICSADVASALAMAGVLDYTSGLTGAGGPSIGQVDDTGNLMVGTINGRIKVFVDPYSANVSNDHYYVMGYKGTSPYDAGLFYCPYVPLQMLRSIDPNTFQPKIGFKTRYGMVANPFVFNGVDGNGVPIPDAEALTASKNMYYRRVRIQNLM